MARGFTLASLVAFVKNGRIVVKNETCGDSLMVEQLTFQLVDSGSIPTSPLHFNIKQINVQAACDLNFKWHSRLPKVIPGNIYRNRHYVCYGAEFDGAYFAVAIWSSPVAANRFKNGGNILELRRLAIASDAPFNTATRMLKIMRLDIKKRFPTVTKLISYQDKEVHQGTLYTAAGRISGAVSEGVSWSATGRKRNKDQTTATKVRWEFVLRDEINSEPKPIVEKLMLIREM